MMSMMHHHHGGQTHPLLRPTTNLHQTIGNE